MIVLRKSRSAWRFFRKYGFRKFLWLLFQNRSVRWLYRRWRRREEPKVEDLVRQRDHRFTNAPLISVITPCYNTPSDFLAAMIASVRRQTYSHWELCLAVALPFPAGSKQVLEEAARADSRIKIEYLKENLGISGNTNAALDMASGDYAAFLDHDDLFLPWTLFEVVAAANEHPDADVIYSDEDRVDANGRRRHHPHFKSDWNPDMLRGYNYITHLLVIRRSLVEELGGIRPGFEGAQDYDLVLRATEKAGEIVHIPKILYHWREHPASTALNSDAKEGLIETTQRVVAEHLKRIGRPAKVERGPFFFSAHTTYELQWRPLVSIVIPNRDHADVLRRCLDSLFERTNYSNFEVIVMENGSTEAALFEYYEDLKVRPNVQIVTWDKPFNYAEINNDALAHCKGEAILFLNNDVEVTNSDWLDEMLGHLQWPENGAVGAKLLFPDGKIQHAGAVIGIDGAAGHSHKGIPDSSVGYFGRLKVPLDVSAVTGACLLVKRSIFEDVGGFDTRFQLALNDMDLCLKIRKGGYLIVFTPYARLTHYESETRGPEDSPEKKARYENEKKLFQEAWKDVLANPDPYYSPNLTQVKEDFSLLG